MDKYSLYVPNFLPKQELPPLQKGNACPGCGVSLALRHIAKAADGLLEKAVCERANGSKPFGCTTGVAFVKIKQGKKEIVVCLDDETGGGLDQAVRKPMPEVAVAEGFTYVATASPSYPFDLYDKVNRAVESPGNAYLHILCPSPVSWQFENEDTVKMGFWAVESNAFPLYEVAGGYYNMTVKILKPRPLADYIKAQGRFAEVSEKEFKSAEAAVAKAYKKLLENIEPA